MTSTKRHFSCLLSEPEKSHTKHLFGTAFGQDLFTFLFKALRISIRIWKTSRFCIQQVNAWLFLQNMILPYKTRVNTFPCFILILLALNVGPYGTVKITKTKKPLGNGRLFEFLTPLSGNAIQEGNTIYTDICLGCRKESLTEWGKDMPR